MSCGCHGCLDREVSPSQRHSADLHIRRTHFNNLFRAIARADSIATRLASLCIASLSRNCAEATRTLCAEPARFAELARSAAAVSFLPLISSSCARNSSIINILPRADSHDSEACYALRPSRSSSPPQSSEVEHFSALSVIFWSFLGWYEQGWYEQGWH